MTLFDLKMTNFFLQNMFHLNWIFCPLKHLSQKYTGTPARAPSTPTCWPSWRPSEAKLGLLLFICFTYIHIPQHTQFSASMDIHKLNHRTNTFKTNFWDPRKEIQHSIWLQVLFLILANTSTNHFESKNFHWSTALTRPGPIRPLRTELDLEKPCIGHDYWERSFVLSLGVIHGPRDAGGGHADPKESF